jgi:hypothetical protein
VGLPLPGLKLARSPLVARADSNVTEGIVTKSSTRDVRSRGVHVCTAHVFALKSRQWRTGLDRSGLTSMRRRSELPKGYREDYFGFASSYLMESRLYSCAARGVLMRYSSGFFLTGALASSLHISTPTVMRVSGLLGGGAKRRR